MKSRVEKVYDDRDAGDGDCSPYDVVGVSFRIIGVDVVRCDSFEDVRVSVVIVVWGRLFLDR